MCYHVITFVNTANMPFTWVSKHLLHHNTVYIVFCKLIFSKNRGKYGNFTYVSYFSLSYLRKILIFWKIQFTKNNIYILLCCNMCMLTHVKRMFEVFTNVMVWYYMCYITSITSYNIFPILFFFRRQFFHFP